MARFLIEQGPDCTCDWDYDEGRHTIEPWTEVCVCLLGAECHAHEDPLTRAKARAIAALEEWAASITADLAAMGVKTTITIEVGGDRL